MGGKGWLGEMQRLGRPDNALLPCNGKEIQTSYSYTRIGIYTVLYSTVSYIIMKLFRYSIANPGGHYEKLPNYKGDEEFMC